MTIPFAPKKSAKPGSRHSDWYFVKTPTPIDSHKNGGDFLFHIKKFNANELQPEGRSQARGNRK
jgi:hypothetical protein